MIKDGYLKTVKKLLLAKNTIITKDTLSDIEDFIKDGGICYVVEGFEPTVLETGEKVTVGEKIEGYDFFGEEKEVFYTDHGSYITEYVPHEGRINHIDKTD